MVLVLACDSLYATEPIYMQPNPFTSIWRYAKLQATRCFGGLR